MGSTKKRGDSKPFALLYYGKCFDVRHFANPTCATNFIYHKWCDNKYPYYQKFFGGNFDSRGFAVKPSTEEEFHRFRKIREDFLIELQEKKDAESREKLEKAKQREKAILQLVFPFMSSI